MGVNSSRDPDFSGYATRAGVICTDGRTILPDAFKHQDGKSVPLVWQHAHNDVRNVLGHAELENRSDGVYARCYTNNSESGAQARELVKHGDISSLSIFANRLRQEGGSVRHGTIREVSLVLAGANPGAFIDNVSISHSDGEFEELDDQAVIYSGESIVQHADSGAPSSASNTKTVEDIYNAMSEQEKTVVHFLVGMALEEPGGSAQHGAVMEDYIMTRNIFEGGVADGPSLTHSDLENIVSRAKKVGSLKEAFLEHAASYGIENIDILFPDAKNISSSPELISRKMEWVSKVTNKAKHSPFSRIKTMSADITHDEARAKGYIKGNMKKEEFFALAKRVTTPTTIYKKQKLDRDDIVDITDLDVVSWLKAEMRIMLDEEIARAILVGDGREVDDEDKIDESKIRPIAKDDSFYAHQVQLQTNTNGSSLVEAIIRSRPNYRGKGSPTLFLTEELLADLLLTKDKLGRRLYEGVGSLATDLRVSEIVTTPVFEGVKVDGGDLVAIMVDMADYTIGADKGGAISMFDDFDIDYNQYKYLMETRISGALTGHKTAVVFSRAAGTLATPADPTFVPTTGVVTIPTVTGVRYLVDGVVATPGAQAAIAAGETVDIQAEPTDGYYFKANITASWSFTRPV